MKKINFLPAVLVVITLLIGIHYSPSSFADDSVETLGGGGPCKRDIEMLCKGVEPGEGRMKKCLRENSDAVSAECKTKMKERRKERKARKAKRAEKRKAAQAQK